MSIRDTAAALGVSRTELCRWHALADLPEAEFERRLAVMRDEGTPLSTSAILTMDAPVPARGRVKRVLGIIKNMTPTERRELMAALGVANELH